MFTNTIFTNKIIFYQEREQIIKPLGRNTSITISLFLLDWWIMQAITVLVIFLGEQCYQEGQSTIAILLSSLLISSEEIVSNKNLIAPYISEDWNLLNYIQKKLFVTEMKIGWKKLNRLNNVFENWWWLFLNIFKNIFNNIFKNWWWLFWIFLKTFLKTFLITFLKTGGGCFE